MLYSQMILISGYDNLTDPPMVLLFPGAQVWVLKQYVALRTQDDKNYQTKT